MYMIFKEFVLIILLGRATFCIFKCQNFLNQEETQWSNLPKSQGFKSSTEGYYWKKVILDSQNFKAMQVSQFQLWFLKIYYQFLCE